MRALLEVTERVIEGPEGVDLQRFRNFKKVCESAC